MSERLSAALRELAAALEEVEGATKDTEKASGSQSAGRQAENCDLGRRPASSGEGRGASSIRGSTQVALESDPCGSSVAYREDWRHYVIVANPRNPSFVGWTSGRGGQTWRELESRLPGGRLSGSAVRLRRVDDKEHAERVWMAAHPGIKMPILPL